MEDKITLLERTKRTEMDSRTEIRNVQVQSRRSHIAGVPKR